MIIGITGRVGSGKSTAVQVIQSRFECEVIDLDTIGHQLLEDPLVKEELIAAFGDDILGNEGHIKRSQLSQLVFSDPEQMKRLNQIIHPPLRATAIQAITAANETAALIIVVGALIAELSLASYCDTIICIDADDSQIQAQIGPKFDHIAPFQRSRDGYRQGAGQTIINTFDTDFENEVVTTIKNLMTDPKSA